MLARHDMGVSVIVCAQGFSFLLTQPPHSHHHAYLGHFGIHLFRPTTSKEVVSVRKLQGARPHRKDLQQEEG